MISWTLPMGRADQMAALIYMLDIDNAGLDACLRTGEQGRSLLQPYQQFCSSISLADFLVIAAEAVMTSTRERERAARPGASAVDFRSQFRFGRTTAQSCDFAQGRLPNPENGCSAVEQTFLQRMGLDWNEAAALMGVHTLGRAQVANSGYHGWWSDPENSRRFNNDYYVSLLAKGWVPERAVSGNSQKNQWERSDIGRDQSFDGHEMMLNTDICLAYSENGNPVSATQHNCCAWLSSNVITGAVQNNGGEFCGGQGGGGAGRERGQCCGDAGANDCGSRNNPSGPAAQAVLSFASNEAAWLQTFLRAWRIATENGFEASLQGLGQCQTSTTASPSSTSSVPTTVPPAEGFFTIDGSVDRVCRGASAQDNLASHYTVASAASLEACQALCMSETSCKGVEFHAASGRCEVWVRPQGIGATAGVPGFTCLGYAGGAAGTTSATTTTHLPTTTQLTTSATPVTTTTTTSNDGGGGGGGGNGGGRRRPGSGGGSRRGGGGGGRRR
eukprot:gb/GFBE01043581.1/.p1 GENE.gb/GFBE01043581.1/~~gb/GFBE01043581.1/.p1  ORF type:complete len:502 (+),score=103.83 gb/GFBE01043581.1/:1-1506(+)